MSLFALPLPFILLTAVYGKALKPVGEEGGREDGLLAVAYYPDAKWDRPAVPSLGFPQHLTAAVVIGHLLLCKPSRSQSAAAAAARSVASSGNCQSASQGLVGRLLILILPQ